MDELRVICALFADTDRDDEIRRIQSGAVGYVSAMLGRPIIAGSVQDYFPRLGALRLSQGHLDTSTLTLRVRVGAANIEEEVLAHTLDTSTFPPVVHWTGNSEPPYSPVAVNPVEVSYGVTAGAFEPTETELIKEVLAVMIADLFAVYPSTTPPESTMKTAQMMLNAIAPRI